MPKSIKLKNDTYIDASGVTYNRNKISDIMNKNHVYDGGAYGSSGTDLTGTVTVKTATVTTRTGRILVSFYIRCGVDVNNCWLRLFIDSTKFLELGINKDTQISLTKMVNASIGSHTVKLVLQQSNNNTMYYNGFPQPQLEVCEI